MVSFLCSTVQAEVIKEIFSEEGYNAQGYKTVNSPCTVAGIAQDYANKSFLKGFLPADKQEGLKSVSWNPSTKKMQIIAKETFTLACDDSLSANSISLMCRFDPVPPGVKFLWFKITRTQEADRCVETGISQGQFSNLVKVKGYSPGALHEQVANAFLTPYRESSARVARTPKQGTSVPTRATASSVIHKQKLVLK